ncbi:hypothetical protein PGIGA_G00247120 [Pangasianodon gigas]|uniref:Uncharacterized protein n=1 Tax=Pangasianodon gigas TaxID=30993 RepID=A0ACC5WQC3_PANGG|nr:hypothetical protein [Pangasianodon gigas]
MKVLSSHLCGVCFLFMWTIRSTSVLDVSGTHQGIPPAVVKLWASAFGGEMKSIAAKYSGSQLLQKVHTQLIHNTYQLGEHDHKKYE